MSDSPVRPHSPGYLSPTNPLVEAAVDTLSTNAEQRLTALSILVETADPNHPDAVKTMARWKAIDAARKSPDWKFVVLVLAILIAIPMVGYQIPDLNRAWQYRDSFETWEFPDPQLPEGLTDSEKLLFGDLSKSNFEQTESKKSLHLSDPARPEFYFEYAAAHQLEFGDFPEDYFEIVSRIDPENSSFHYIAAGIAAKGIIDQKPFTDSKGGSESGEDGMVAEHTGPIEEEFLILDRAAFEKSLSLLAKASSLPKYETYGDSMLRRKLRVLPRKGTYAEQVDKLVLLSTGSARGISASNVMYVICACAQELSLAGDVEGFLALVEIREHFTNAIATDSELSLLSEIIFASSGMMTAEYLYHGAKRLGLEEVSAKYFEQYNAFKDSSAARRVRRKHIDDIWVEERGAPMVDPFLVSISAVVESPPPITVSDLAPVRYADHALAMRFGLAAIAAALVLGSLLVFAFRFIFPPALRKTAERLVILLRPVDWAIVVGVGTVLPFLTLLALQRFSGWGGREWAVDHFRYLFPGTHLVAILLVILFSPVLLARWRLLKRSGCLGIPCRSGLATKLALLFAIALPLVAYPMVLKFGPTQLLMKALAAVPAFCLIVVIWSVLQSVVSKAAPRISLAAMSMILLPPYAIAIILSSLALPIYRSAEENWLAQDTLQNPDPDAVDFGQYEYRLAAEKRRETRAILGLEK